VTPADWPTAERAIAKWVRDSIDVPVVWAYQAVQRPEPPIAVLHVAELESQGQGHDETSAAPEASPALGEELVVRTTQWWTLKLNVHVLTAQTAVAGNQSPHALLTRSLAHLRREDMSAALAVAGLGVIGFEKIVSDPEVFQTVWQPVAMADVHFNFVEEVEMRLGYIATAEGTADLGNGTTQVELEMVPAP
jgi:hypothetical protein